MSLQRPLTCVNCGTALQPPVRGSTGIHCPVCHLLNDVGATAQPALLTRDALERGLSDLVAQARAGALSDEEILATLRDELEFAAELANADRYISVQIVDLGPREGQVAQQPVRDRTTVLRSRALGG
jgi:hypothetical protein